MSDVGTYDSIAAKTISLDSAICLFKELNADNIYIKELSPNDNSKNQPYFGCHLSDISFLPTNEIETTDTSSNKARVKDKNGSAIKFLASINLTWVDPYKNKFSAPNAKLIYYPQYPEVRFSGFIRGSDVNISEWMDPNKSGRTSGRWLLLGITKQGLIYAFLALPNSRISKELNETKNKTKIGVFYKLNTNNNIHNSYIHTIPTKELLLQKLKEIHNKGWIPGYRLDSNGNKRSCSAPNAGGYTLEAELGITPNGFAEPDFFGWEIKQFSIKKFPKIGAQVTTLMTPEPDGGIYKSKGVEEVLRIYGYPDQNGVKDRINFGGIHYANSICPRSNLKLCFLGFDNKSRKITDADGSIALVDINENVAASWSFKKIIGHWKRKHSQTAYVPCLKKSLPRHKKEFFFGNEVELGITTNIELLLSALADHHIYYDPAIKLENATSLNSKSKRRNQFRTKHANLENLYRNYEYVDLLNYYEFCP